MDKTTDLEQLRIHELRDLARKMGVQAPTVLKKEEIIEEIMKIMNGETEPFTRHNKKGRPARNGADNFNVVDFILPKPEDMHEVESSGDYNLAQDKFTWVLNMESASYGGEIKPHKCSGIVELKPEGYGVLHIDGICPSERDVFVSKNIVKQLNLKSGDCVNCWAKLIKDGYPETAYEVVRVGEESKFDFDTAKTDRLGESHNIDENISKFKLGGRYFLKTNEDVYDVVPEIAEKMKKEIKNTKVITFYLNAMIERINYECTAQLEYIPFNKMDEEVVIASDLFFEKCKRMVEKGNNVVVILSGLSQLAKSCNTVFLRSNNYQEVSAKTSFKIKNILALAKRFNEESSLSLVCVDDLKIPHNILDMFEYEILPLF